jgi:hypothetical protein
MNLNEQDQLRILFEKFSQHAEETKRDLASIKEDMEDVKLGIYGNEKNKVLGLLDRQIKDEERIEKLETFRKKAMWIGTGFVAALQAIGIAVWEFFTSK